MSMYSDMEYPSTPTRRDGADRELDSAVKTRDTRNVFQDDIPQAEPKDQLEIEAERARARSQSLSVIGPLGSRPNGMEAIGIDEDAQNEDRLAREAAVARQRASLNMLDVAPKNDDEDGRLAEEASRAQRKLGVGQDDFVDREASRLRDPASVRDEELAAIQSRRLQLETLKIECSDSRQSLGADSFAPARSGTIRRLTESEFMAEQRGVPLASTYGPRPGSMS